MLAKMPQKTVKSPFRNKLTIISLVLLMGLGLSAAYFTVPFLQSPIPTQNNLMANTTNNTVSAPVSHPNLSAINIQTPDINSTPTTNTNTSTVTAPNTSTTKQDSNMSKQGTNTNKQGTNTSKTTTNTSKNTKSSTNTKSTNTTG